VLGDVGIAEEADVEAGTMKFQGVAMSFVRHQIRADIRQIAAMIVA
jgi:hypothetical protein